MSVEKIVLGVLAGAATGALLGVLFAPARGAVTRRSIVRKGERQMDDLKDKFNDFVDNITEKFEKVKEDVTDFADDAKASVKATAREAEKAEKEMKHAKA